MAIGIIVIWTIVLTSFTLLGGQYLLRWWLNREKIMITIKGKAAKAVKTLGRITGVHEPVDVIIRALRNYEWILAQQTKDWPIIAESPNPDTATSLELVNYIKDKDLALSFFQGRDISVDISPRQWKEARETPDG